MLHAVAILIAASPLLSIHGNSVALLTSMEYHYTGGGYRDELFRYRLFIPETSSSSVKLPLIVWLHGVGEAGEDNVEQLKWIEHLVFTPPWKREKYPFYFLTVQCPSDNPGWTQGGPSEDGDDMINVARAILDKTLQDYPIDRDRVVLAGISSGGAGCWEFSMRHPEYFAAVAPMSSGGGDNARVNQIKDVPVWAFHCNRDGGIESVRSTVQTLKIAGGNAHLTEINAESHDSWTSAFNDHHLLDWLLAQRRGQPSVPPGTIPLMTRLRLFSETWQWWQVLVQVGIPAVLIVVVWNAVRHGRRKIAKTG